MTARPPANVTEFVFCKIKPGHATRLLDTSTAEGKALTQAFTHILNGKGCQRLAYGVPEEDQDIPVTMFDWDSIEAHTTFRDSVDQTAQKDFWSWLGGMPFFFHAPIEYCDFRAKEMQTLLRAEVTEITLRYYPTSVTTQGQEKYQHALLYDMAKGNRVSGGVG